MLSSVTLWFITLLYSFTKPENFSDYYCFLKKLELWFFLKTVAVNIPRVNSTCFMVFIKIKKMSWLFLRTTGLRLYHKTMHSNYYVTRFPLSATQTSHDTVTLKVYSKTTQIYPHSVKETFAALSVCFQH